MANLGVALFSFGAKDLISEFGEAASSFIAGWQAFAGRPWIQGPVKATARSVA
jgi:hypothetical protein